MPVHSLSLNKLDLLQFKEKLYFMQPPVTQKLWWKCQ